jgi:hypothetical protein
MKKKSKCASLAQQNGFGPAVLRSLLRVVKGTPKAPCVDWPNSLIRPGGFLLVVSHLFAVPVLVLWVGLKKEYITKIEYEKYFCMITHILGTHSWRCSTKDGTFTMLRSNPQKFSYLVFTVVEV